MQDLTQNPEHLRLSLMSRDPCSCRSLPGNWVLVLEDRRKARAEKNWAESDRIRDLLASFGITVKDTKEGATWTLD